MTKFDLWMMGGLLAIGTIVGAWDAGAQSAAEAGMGATAASGFLRGVGYSPWHAKYKNWIGPGNVEEFAEDMALMRELRINAVRRWGPITREGLEHYRKAGLKVIPQIRTDKLPKTCFVNGHEHGVAFCAPEASAAMREGAARLAKDLVGEPSIAAYLLGNEYSWVGCDEGRYEYVGFDDATVRAYQRWISQRFRTIEDWNRLTGRSDASFDSICPPRGAAKDSAWWEWWLFNRQVFGEFMKSGYEGIRRYDPATPVSYALLCGNRWDAATEDAALGFLDIQGDNLYWGWDKDWAGYGVRLARRIGAGRPALITEFGFTTFETAATTGALDAGEKPEGGLEEPARAARLMTQNLWLLALHPEVKGVFPFLFNDEWWHGKDPARQDCTADCFGLITADRKHIKKIGHAVGACYTEFEQIDPFLATRSASAEVLITDQVADWWRKNADGPKLASVARELYRHGVNFHLVSLLQTEDLDRSPCRRLILLDSVIPDNPDQTSPAMDALRRFTQKGGEILYISSEPWRSLYGTAYPVDGLARVVTPPGPEPLWPVLVSFLSERRTVVSGDESVFWRVLDSANGPHLILVVTGEQPAARIEVSGFAAVELVAGDAGAFATTKTGCVLTQVATHAVIRGKPVQASGGWRRVVHALWPW
ncbi:MAG: hypothetical protein A3K19_08975 [Lentisphaerae bacterium RIFOXYB12_FULL_65_16]|nr:MAG: hypothetical protein A3K18_13650 [Lentisphaerae bacterium RIFOXYA12_64_32]OGV87680.1 MAG: hypothetical protein A3K19_08975 [Lentisphaerae bacterium RIFOXYB12_FULL_65_16]